MRTQNAVANGVANVVARSWGVYQTGRTSRTIRGAEVELCVP